MSRCCYDLQYCRLDEVITFVRRKALAYGLSNRFLLQQHLKYTPNKHHGALIQCDVLDVTI